MPVATAIRTAGRVRVKRASTPAGFTPVAAWFKALRHEVRRGVRGPRFSIYLFKGKVIVAKVTPGEYIRQVRAEGSKVVWPSMKETRTTAIMVLIMTSLLALFFLGVDSAFSAIVQFLLGLLG
jgi:preprotein translocase subunit SecE